MSNIGALFSAENSVAVQRVRSRYFFLRISACFRPLKYRYSRQNTTPQIPPLFSQKHIPHHSSATDTTDTNLPVPTNLPNPASLWKFSQAHQAPRHTRREHTHNTGRKDSHSIMVIIIIMISIRLIYIFIWDDLACFLGLFLYTKRKRFF